MPVAHGPAILKLALQRRAVALLLRRESGVDVSVHRRHLGAAVIGFNLLMVGPPGAGKSLLAACLPGILPPLTPAEALEVSMEEGVAGTIESGRLEGRR